MEKYIYTCILCQSKFENLDFQKAHFSSDWHRFNLKRKVADLPAISKETFIERVLQQQSKSNLYVEDDNSLSLTCDLCNKTYASQNALDNHLQSRKHRDAVARKTPTENKAETEKATFVDQEKKRNWKLEFARARTEQDMLQLMEEKYQETDKLDELDCLFCRHRSQCINTNLSHMSKKHSFFIPDVEFCSDIVGLLRYLGEKVAVGNVCMYCNGRGKQIHSLEAVRNHMIDLGHTKMDYENGSELEYAEFYDYEDSDADGGWEDVSAFSSDDDSSSQVHSLKAEATISPLTEELVLASGERLGNRKYSCFYRQNLREKNEKSSTVIKRLMENYRQLGQLESSKLSKAARATMIAEKVYRAKFVHEKLAISQKANNQAHFRPQVMY